MNLYSQGAFYFGTDEVYFFHMVIIERMNASAYNPEDYVNTVTLETDIAPQLFRKLKSIAKLISEEKY